MSESGTRKHWRAPVLLVLGVAATVALAYSRSRQESGEGVDARCDLAALESRAPSLDTVALDDHALLALGGEALADVLEYCEAIDPWQESVWRSQGREWSSRLADDESSVAVGRSPPVAVTELSRRTCGPHEYQRIDEALYRPVRQISYATFELCRLEARKVLSSSDVDYLDPSRLSLWRLHQMLLESRVPEDLARRYFTAILVAAEIDERAMGAVRVRAGQVEFTDLGEVSVVSLTAQGRLAEGGRALEQKFSIDEGCVFGRVRIGAREPIGSLRWLLEAEFDPERCNLDTFTLAVHERERLLRPLRADVDAPLTGRDQPFDLELMLDGDGGFVSVGGLERGPDAEALMSVLDRVKPRTVLVRVDPSTPAAEVVDLLRVPDVWRARKRRELALHLLLDDSGA